MQGQAGEQVGIEAGEQVGIEVVEKMKPEEGRSERPVVLGLIFWWQLEGVELG